MLPADTRSPPNFFTPRYWGLLVRPFLEEPTPFLCAMESPDLHAGDPDLGEFRPMPRLPAIVLPALELEDVDLLPLDAAHAPGGAREGAGRRQGREDLRLQVQAPEE